MRRVLALVVVDGDFFEVQRCGRKHRHGFRQLSAGRPSGSSKPGVEHGVLPGHRRLAKASGLIRLRRVHHTDREFVDVPVYLTGTRRE